jgi:transposase
MRTLIVGIDVSQAHNDVGALTETGEVVDRHRRFANDRIGFEEFTAWAAEVFGAGEYDRMQIGGEATGLHWFHTFWQLQELDDIGGLSPELYLMNAHGVAHFKKALRQRDKTDAQDAHAIAENMRFGPLPHPLKLDIRYFGLQRLTRYRFYLVHSLAREKVYAAQVALVLKMNTYQAGEPFSDPFAKSGQWALTTYATADELATCDINDLARALRQVSRGMLADPWVKAAELQHVAARAYPLPTELVEPVNQILTSLLAHITFLESQLAVFDQQIETLAQTLPGYDLLTSIPGIGPVYAAGLLAEIQDVQRFMTDAQGHPRTTHQGQSALAKFAGLWWPRIESGKLKGEARHMAKSGNHYLRYYLVQGANGVRLNAPDYQAFYHRKHREAVRFKHRRALVLTARKLIRLVFSLLQKNEMYQLPGGAAET